MPRISRARLVMVVIAAAMLSIGGLRTAGVLADVGISQVTTTSGETTTTESTTEEGSELPTATPPDVSDAQREAAHRRQVAALRKAIKYTRQATNRWWGISLMPVPKSRYLEQHTSDAARLQRLLKWLRGERAKAQRYAQNPPHKAMWLCIHSGIRGGRWVALEYQGGGYKVGGGEASWLDHASNNAHYGGLQLGMWFMSTYAPELLASRGTADQWPPLQQIWVAERAYKREGYSQSWLFGQWGATAPPCF